MYVPGYTHEKKELVLCEFSADEILKHGIDPERIDLCEPDPIAIECEGKGVLFSPMRSLSIARLDSERAEIALVRGCERSVFSATRVGDSQRKFENVQPGSASFDEIFADYVQFREHDHYRRDPPRPQNIWYGDGDLVEVEGGIVELADLPDNTCCGEMFEWLPCALDTPEMFDWILETFAEWKPVILGRAVYNAFAGKTVRHIDVIVEHPSMEDIKDLCDRLGMQKTEWMYIEGYLCAVKFQRDDISIEIWERLELHDNFPWLTNDMMECREKGWIQVRRITAFDIDVSQYRILCGNWPNMGITPEGTEIEEDLIFIKPESINGLWRVQGSSTHPYFGYGSPL